MAEDDEFRVMPSGDGRWYWEVITPGPTVIARGVADSEPAACKGDSDAARKAKLIDRSGSAEKSTFTGSGPGGRRWRGGVSWSGAAEGCDRATRFASSAVRLTGAHVGQSGLTGPGEAERE
jgi:hypothetical protein